MRALKSGILTAGLVGLVSAALDFTVSGSLLNAAAVVSTTACLLGLVMTVETVADAFRGTPAADVISDVDA
jgi:energy-converting hydrogenase Eha subunit C